MKAGSSYSEVGLANQPESQCKIVQVFCTGFIARHLCWFAGPVCAIASLRRGRKGRLAMEQALAHRNLPFLTPPHTGDCLERQHKTAQGGTRMTYSKCLS